MLIEIIFKCDFINCKIPVAFDKEFTNKGLI